MNQIVDLGARTAAVMQAIRQRIDRRALTPGARLPSVRAMAASVGVSKSTVVEAYDRLAAEGLIRSRPGSGFFVAAPLAPLTLAEMAPAREREVDPLWLLRQSILDRPTALKPGCGWLPNSWMPEELMRKGLRAIARNAPPSLLLGSDTAAGSEPLRRLLARRMLDQGIDCAPDQVLLTDSATHGIDLILRFMIEPGAVVLVDDPCYFNFHALLRAYRVKVVGVPFTPHGPDVAAFTQAVAEHRPRLYLTNSAIHNPTGATLSAATAHKILKLAEASDLIIIEDDVFGDLEYEPAPRMAAFDGLERVIRTGSFSKTLSGAVRCGYIAARWDWIAALTDLRISTGITGSPLAAELVHAALTDGGYRRHLDKVRTRLAKARDEAIGRLARIGITPWIKPASGLFLWCALPPGVDAADVARRGLEQDIIFAPGDAFSVAGSASGYMRFNVAMMNEPRVFEALEAFCARVG